MDLSRAMNEIKRLEEFNSGKNEYVNICKVLKEMVALPLMWTNDNNKLNYFVSNLKYLIENKPGTSLSDDVNFGIEELHKLNDSAFDDETQLQATNIIANMYSILVSMNKNQMNTLSFLYKIFNDQPLTPLTDNDDDWDEVGEVEGFKIYKHKRCDKVFKNERTNIISYTEGIVFVYDGKYIINEYSAVELKLPSMLPETQFINIKK